MEIRLSKLTRQFNIGLQTLVDFLNAKGAGIELNPNAKISDSYLPAIEARFGDEQKRIRDSEKVAIKLKEIIERGSKEKSPAEDGDEPVKKIIIKNSSFAHNTPVMESIETPSPTQKLQSAVEEPKIVDKIDLSKFEKDPLAEDKKEEPCITPISAETQKTLWDWAYMGDYNKNIADLKAMALEERWYYKEQPKDNPYPILKKYLEYTFIRLTKEEATIKYSEDGAYAAFNTGLVDHLYESIYALFAKNKNKGKQPWHFLNFCTPGKDKAGKTLSSNFKPLPERAHYFKNPSELIYDATQAPHVDWEHIILEHVDRLPLFLLEEYIPDELKDTSILPRDGRKQYYKHLAKVIKNNDVIYRRIKNRFKDSLELALHRVAWNYKTAIPIYYPATNKLSLLLPLSLNINDNIDLALVTERQASGNYIGHTILTLNMAYSNARLITRPDSDWLTPVTEETDFEEED